MRSKDQTVHGYFSTKVSIEGGVVRSEQSPPAPLSRENASKISKAVHGSPRPPQHPNGRSKG
jgi:hypothetical protein